MNFKFLKTIRLQHLVLGVFILSSFLIGTKAEAAVLAPGALFSACGDIQAPGTYYLNADISTTTRSTCLNVTSDGVIISATTTKSLGAGTGGVSIMATSTGGHVNGYSFTVTGIVNVNGDINASSTNAGTNGLVTFNGTSTVSGVLTGNATFNNTSYNSGVVTGNATFYNSGYNNNTVNGNANFNDLSYNAARSWAEQTVPGFRNWKSIASSGNGTKLVAAVYGGFIYTSADSGINWTQRMSDTNRNWTSVTSSSDGAKLAAAASGGYIYTSTDYGANWAQATTSGSRSWNAIVSTSDAVKLVAAAWGGYIYTSADSGASWAQATTSTTQPWQKLASSNDGSKVVAAGDNDKIYTSADYGVTWAVSTSSVMTNWGALSISGDGTKIVAANGAYVYTSADFGLTWTQVNIVYSNWNALAQSYDGKQILVGSSGSYLYISNDYGTTWTQLTSVGAHNWSFANSSLSGNRLNAVTSSGYVYTSTIGTVLGTATFNGNSYSYNASSGSISPQAGLASSTVSFVPTSGNTVTFNIGAAGITNACSSARCIFSTNTSTYNFGNSTSIYNFYGNAELATTTSIVGNTVNFFDSSFSVGSVTASSTVFGGTSYNGGDVIGNVVFNDSSFNSQRKASVVSSNGGRLLTGTISLDGTKIAFAPNGSQALSLSNDSGVSWTRVTPNSNTYWISITSSDDGKKIAVADYSNNGYPGSGYVYVSADTGATWTKQLGSGPKNWQLVKYFAHGTRLAGSVGGYLYFSSDDGNSWATSSVPQGNNCYSLAVSSEGDKIVAACGMNLYTSIDSGVTWATFNGGGNWVSVAMSTDGKKMFAFNNSDYGVYKSTDFGVTWTKKFSRPSNGWAGDSIAVSPDGTVVLLSVYNGYLYQSPDSGESWANIGSDGGAYVVVMSSAGSQAFVGSENGSITNFKSGLITGNAIFNNSAYNGGVVAGNAIFTNTTYLYNASSTSFSPQLGAASTTTFAPATGSTITFNIGTASTTNACSSVQCVFSSNTTSYNFGTSTVTYNFYGNAELATTTSIIGNSANFFDSSINAGNITASSTTFGGTSYSSGNIIAINSIFNTNSYNLGAVTASTTVFNGNAYNNGPVAGSTSFNDSSSNAGTLSPMVQRVNSGSKPWTGMTSSADGTKLAAIANGDYIYTSSDAGVTWTPRTTSFGSKYWSVISSSADGRKLVAIVSGHESYISSDYGVTWATTTVPCGNTYNNWSSIASSADGTKIAVVNGNSSICLSTNSGNSWGWMPNGAGNNLVSITMSADGTKLAVVAVGGHVFTTTGFNSPWVDRTPSTAWAWQSIVSSADGKKLAAVDSGNNPGVGFIHTSTDYGVTWTVRAVDTPRQWNYISSSADGSVLVASSINQAGAGAYISTDSGVTWKPKLLANIYRASALSSDGKRLVLAPSYDYIYTASSGVVDGNATFSGASFNQGIVSNNAIFTNNSYSWNTTTQSFSPQAGTVLGTNNFTPAIGSTVTFNVGSSTINNACSSAQCAWNIDTSTYNFGTATPYVKLYGNAKNTSTTTVQNFDFYDSSYNSANLIASSTTFHGSSYNNTTGVVNASSTPATFTDTSYNLGAVQGNAKFSTTHYDSVAPTGGAFTLSGTSTWSGLVTGNILDSNSTPINSFNFSGSSHNETPIILPTYFSGSSYNNSTITTASSTVFAGSSYNAGVVSASSTLFSGTSHNTATVNGPTKFTTTYYDSASSTAPTAGVLTLSGSRIWEGEVDGILTGSDDAEITDFAFTGLSSNAGTVNADADVYYPAQYPIQGIVIGNITYHNYPDVGVYFNSHAVGGDENGDWSDIKNWWMDASSTIPAQNLPNRSSDVFILDSLIANTGYPAIVHHADFSKGARNQIDLTVSAGATFNDTSRNFGTLHGNSLFTGDSYSDSITNGGFGVDPMFGAITGTTTFNPIGTTTVTFNIGTLETPADCDGSQCVWSDNMSRWDFGPNTPVWNFYGDSYLATTTVIIPGASMNFRDNSYTQALLTVPSTASLNFYDDSMDLYNTFGSATFSDRSSSQGYITGDAVFNDKAINYGQVVGTSYFTADTFSGYELLYGSSANPQLGYSYGGSSKTVFTAPHVTFNVDTSDTNDPNYGCPDIGVCQWYDSGDMGYWTFAGTAELNFYGNSSYQGYSTFPEALTVNFYNGSSVGADGSAGGVGTFNDDSYNYGYWTGTPTFLDNSANYGTIIGDAEVYLPVVKPLGGTVSGHIHYHGYPAFYFNDTATSDGGHGTVGDWGDAQNWWSDEAFTTHAGSVPGASDDAYVYNNITSNSGDAAEVMNVNFEGSSQNNIAITVNGTATFNDTSTNTGSILGNTVFTGNNSNNNGRVDRPFGAQPSSMELSWFSFAPSTDGSKVAASGNYNNSNNRLYTSNDGGATWATSSFPTSNNAIFVAASADGTKLIAKGTQLLNNVSYGYIYTSTDSGVSWATTTLPAAYWSSVTSSANGQRLAAVNGNTGKIHVSTDGGTNWTTSSLPVESNRTWSNVQYSPDGTKLIALSNYGDYYISSSDGSSWTNMTYATFGNKNWTNMAVSTDGSKLFAGISYGSNYIYMSTTSGATWATSTSSGLRDWRVITASADGTKLAAVTSVYGDPIYISNDSGLTWTTLKNSTLFNECWAYIKYSADGTRLFAGSAYRNNVYTFTSNDNAGPLTRIFTTSVATTRDFLTEGGRQTAGWIIVAQNAIVDLTHATYDLAIDIFKALAGGSFISNPDISGGVSVVPTITISSPLATTTIKWVPSINWDTAVTCEYKMDIDTTYHTLDCSRNGSDIPRPTAALHTLWIRGADVRGNTTEKSVVFTYDNTKPTYTVCGTDLLDEPTRPYYFLQGNITASTTCTITTNNVELRGAEATTSPAFTLTGNVTAAGLNLTLKNINITGTVSSSATTTGAVAGNINIASSTIFAINAIGANGASGIAGGNGGNVTVSDSSTGDITADGGDPPHKGGDGGTVVVVNSYAISSGRIVSAKGGDSSCGYGGSGGVINLTDTLNYVPVVAKGNDYIVGACAPAGGTLGHTGSSQIIGVYTPPGPRTIPGPGPGPTPRSTVGTSLSLTTPYVFGDVKSPLVIPVADVKPLVLVDLPVFGGTGKNAFSFEPLISNFLFSPLANISGNSSSFLKNTPALKSYLSKLGLSSTQDLMLLSNKRVALPIPEKVADIPEGLIMLSDANGTSIPLSATRELGSMPTEFATVTASSTITVSLYPTTKLPVTITFNGKTYTMQKAVKGTLLSTSITLPGPGTFTLTVSGAPLPLVLKVELPKTTTPSVEKVKKQSVWSYLKFW